MNFRGRVSRFKLASGKKVAEVEGVLGVHMACCNEWNSLSGSLVKLVKSAKCVEGVKLDVSKKKCDYKDGEMIFGPLIQLICLMIFVCDE